MMLYELTSIYNDKAYVLGENYKEAYNKFLNYFNLSDANDKIINEATLIADASRFNTLLPKLYMFNDSNEDASLYEVSHFVGQLFFRCYCVANSVQIIFDKIEGVKERGCLKKTSVVIRRIEELGNSTYQKGQTVIL